MIHPRVFCSVHTGNWTFVTSTIVDSRTAQRKSFRQSRICRASSRNADLFDLLHVGLMAQRSPKPIRRRLALLPKSPQSNLTFGPSPPYSEDVRAAPIV